MNNRLTFAAKPTTYKGVRYRSRLEASWAVFWTFLSERFRLEVSYEDFRLRNGIIVEWAGDSVATICPEYFDGKLAREANEYVPDFRLVAKSQWAFFHEVKPKYPNRDYVLMLTMVASFLGLMGGHPLLLSCGGFREEKLPIVYQFPYVFHIPLETFCCEVLGMEDRLFDDAFHEARNFRWDLYDADSDTPF